MIGTIDCEVITVCPAKWLQFHCIKVVFAIFQQLSAVYVAENIVLPSQAVFS